MERSWPSYVGQGLAFAVSAGLHEEITRTPLERWVFRAYLGYRVWGLGSRPQTLNPEPVNPIL